MNYRKLLLSTAVALGLSFESQSKADDLRDADEAAAIAHANRAAQPTKREQRFEDAAMVPIIGATGTITEQPAVIYSWDDTSESVMRFDGRSWTVTKKDIRTGQIERFKQSGTGTLGQLEVMHGEAVTGASGALQRPLFTWVGVEDAQPAKLASRKPTPLPKTMRDDVAGAILSMPVTAGDAINNLLPDDVRREMTAERKALAARLNAEQAAPAMPARTANPNTLSPGV